MPESDKIVFKMNVPIPIKLMDKVEVHAIAMDEAEIIAVNFVNDAQNVAYNFRWILARNVVLENFKKDGKWGSHKQFEFQCFQGNEFRLEFVFAKDFIYTYLLRGNDRHLISRFGMQFALNEIKVIQVCGNISKVPQMSFTYSKP